MSDMDDCELRGDGGYPPLHGWIYRGTGGVNAPVDNSTNKAMPWVALACSFGFLGFGAAFATALMARGQIEAEGRAVKAEMRAEFAQQLADLKAEARAAGTDAAIARNTAQKLEARLNERR